LASETRDRAGHDDGVQNGCAVTTTTSPGATGVVPHHLVGLMDVPLVTKKVIGVKDAGGVALAGTNSRRGQQR
jgi:hypothetical protein